MKKETRVDKWKGKWLQGHGTETEHDVVGMVEEGWRWLQLDGVVITEQEQTREGWET